MSIDLIQRVFYSKFKGDYEPLVRFNSWLARSENSGVAEFIVENEKYYWITISSNEFDDFIHQDRTDWLFIYSETKAFKAIGKIMDSPKNLIDKASISISTIWILESDIASIKIGETPVNIYSPHRLGSPLYRIDYDFKLLLTKLRDPTVKLVELVDYKISKSMRRPLR